MGTHRLVSKDVRFHDLGLVIIDEEQRFGVAQKEKLKQMCNTADVLTLSCHPYPPDTEHGTFRHPGYVRDRRGPP